MFDQRPWPVGDTGWPQHDARKAARRARSSVTADSCVFTIISGVASMEQMEQLLPRDCQGPLLQIVQIQRDIWRGEAGGVGWSSHFMLILH